MESKKLILLFNRYLENNCAEAEIELLMLHFHTDSATLLGQLVKKEMEKNITSGLNDRETEVQTVINRVHLKLKDAVLMEAELAKEKNAATKRLWPRALALIAAVVSLIILGAYFFNYNNKTIGVQTNAYVNDIAPGKMGATLTLGNGKKIRLSDAMNGELAKESGVVITKAVNGQLTYEIKGQQAAGINKMNTLTTANAETYQVSLPDGTTIWLNAGSTLTYPASFAGLKSRIVALTGEAYFEVAKDKAHPFIVESSGQQIEVLGTHFNVSAYKNEASIRTTLLEGRVKVRANHMERSLKPNQQAIFKENNLQVSDVNAKYAVAWKDGFFLFNSETLESIMIKVERWYNVKVKYADPDLKAKTFIGTVNRFEKISKVLNMLEQTGDVIFSIQGNNITINRKK